MTYMSTRKGAKSIPTEVRIKSQSACLRVYFAKCAYCVRVGHSSGAWCAVCKKMRTIVLSVLFSFFFCRPYTRPRCKLRNRVVLQKARESYKNLPNVSARKGTERYKRLRALTTNSGDVLTLANILCLFLQKYYVFISKISVTKVTITYEKFLSISESYGKLPKVNDNYCKFHCKLRVVSMSM